MKILKTEWFISDLVGSWQQAAPYAELMMVGTREFGTNTSAMVSIVADDYRMNRAQIRITKPPLDNFGVTNHNFSSLEIKTCCKVALGLWKIILPSGMHTSRGLLKELILGLLKNVLLYVAQFGFRGYTISNTNPNADTYTHGLNFIYKT